MYNTTHKAMGSGVMIDLANPSPSDIRLDDICHSLSGINRWNGTTDNFYSVASHSLLVGHLFLKARPEATGIELAMALLHDAQEAYVGDVSTPMKSTMKRHAWSRDPECDFERAEHHVVLAIVEHFGILKYFEDHKIDAHHEVIETLKQADRDAAWMESWALFGVDFSPEWRRPQPRGRFSPCATF